MQPIRLSLALGDVHLVFQDPDQDFLSTKSFALTSRDLYQLFQK